MFNDDGANLIMKFSKKFQRYESVVQFTVLPLPLPLPLLGNGRKVCASSLMSVSIFSNSADEANLIYINL